MNRRAKKEGKKATRPEKILLQKATHAACSMDLMDVTWMSWMSWISWMVVGGSMGECNIVSLPVSAPVGCGRDGGHLLAGDVSTVPSHTQTRRGRFPFLHRCFFFSSSHHMT